MTRKLVVYLGLLVLSGGWAFLAGREPRPRSSSADPAAASTAAGHAARDRSAELQRVIANTPTAEGGELSTTILCLGGRVVIYTRPHVNLGCIFQMDNACDTPQFAAERVRVGPGEKGRVRLVLLHDQPLYKLRGKVVDVRGA